MGAGDGTVKNTKLPIFEELDAARSRAELAAWFLAVPLSILMTYERAIRGTCRHRGFGEGLAYCDEVLSAMRAVRDDGAPGAGLEEANAAMRRIAEGG